MQDLSKVRVARRGAATLRPRTHVWRADAGKRSGTMLGPGCAGRAAVGSQEDSGGFCDLPRGMLAAPVCSPVSASMVSFHSS